MSTVTVKKTKCNGPRQLKENLIQFVDELAKSVFRGPGDYANLMGVRIFFLEKSENDIMDHIILHVLPHSSQIKARNTNFFISQRKALFKDLPENIVEYYTQAFIVPESKGGISKDNLDVVWSYFDVFVKLAERHKKRE